MLYDNDVDPRRKGRLSRRTEARIRLMLLGATMMLGTLAASGATLALIHGLEVDGARAADTMALICILVAGLAITTAVLTVGLILFRAIKDLKRVAYQIRAELLGRIDNETDAFNSIAAVADQRLDIWRRKNG